MAEEKEQAARLKRQAALTAARQIKGRRMTLDSKLGKHHALIGELANWLMTGEPYRLLCEPGMTVSQLATTLDNPSNKGMFYAEQITGKLGNFIRMSNGRQTKIYSSLAQIAKKLLDTIPKDFNKSFKNDVFHLMLSWLNDLIDQGMIQYAQDLHGWEKDNGFKTRAEVIKHFEMLRKAWAGWIEVKPYEYGEVSVGVRFWLPGYPSAD